MIEYVPVLTQMVKRIKNILEQLEVQLDEQTVKVIEILDKDKNISENKLAEKLGVKVNAARKSLYKLADMGFASYSKKKDAKKKWWYLYYWQLDKTKINAAYLKCKKDGLLRKKRELETEESAVFQCENDCAKFLYEEALETNFECPECSGMIVEVRNEDALKKLEKEISALEKEIQSIRKAS